MPPRVNIARRALRAPLQAEYKREQARLRRSTARDDEVPDVTARSLDAAADPFDLPSVDLRDDPDAPDDAVTTLSCYGGKLASLSQIVRLDAFTNLASLCVHGCRLTRLEADPLLRACGERLVELNLSSNRIERLEGLPALPALRTLDITNNRLTSLAGLDEGAPGLVRLLAAHNRVTSVHALVIPRVDGEPWALAHLDLRNNNIRTFADVAAGLAAVVSLRALRLTSSGGERAGNPVCAMPSYRNAMAALAPWVEELDDAPLGRAAANLREGSRTLREHAAAARAKARESGEAIEGETSGAGAETSGAGAAAVKDAEPERETSSGSKTSDAARAADAMGASTSLAAPAEMRGKKTPKIDEALSRYKARASANKSPAKKSADRGSYDGLLEEAAEALEDKALAEGKGKKTEDKTDHKSESSAPSSTAKAKDGEKPARPVVKVVKEILREDPAVIDHEMRLQRIERNILSVVQLGRRQAADFVAAAEEEVRDIASDAAANASATQSDLARVERVSGELRALKAQVESMERERAARTDDESKRAATSEATTATASASESEPVTASGGRAKGKGKGKGKRVPKKVVPPPGPPKRKDADERDRADPKDINPPWQHPTAKETRRSWADLAADEEKTEESGEAGGARGDDDATSTAAAAPSSPLLPSAATRARQLERQLDEERANASRAAEDHAAAMAALREDHSKFVAAMNVALSEANAARDAILAGAAADPSKSPDEIVASFTGAMRDRDEARAARDAAEATLADVREESARTLAQMREMHVSELETRARAVSDADAAKTAAETSVEAANERADAAEKRVAAVEDEFRWALKEAEAERAKLKAEAEEMTKVARAALQGKAEAESLAEELAEVCEQQRGALEDLSRDRRRADRAEADCAAARADVGEMTTKLRAAEKRAAAAKAEAAAATKAFEAVKDEKVAAHTALAEIDGVRKQLALAQDNVRVKDAMLESQAELIASLKAEAARVKESSTGAVKAAAESERAADARARRLEDDLRREAAAVDRLEKALEETRAKREEAEDVAAELRREVEERDATLGYVGAEVESVKAMFATREEELRKERDELAVLVAERDEVEAAARNEANAAKEEAAAVKAEAAEAAVAAAAKFAEADAREAEAKESVRRIEGEMRALLSEVAQQKRKTRELGSVLQSLYN